MNSTYEHSSSSFAWKASSFKNPADYLVELTSDDRGEVLAAVEALDRSRSARRRSSSTR